MKIAAVIVTFNRKALLRMVLDSVLGQSMCPEEVIVVNNNSTDGTEQFLEKIKQGLPQIVPLNMEENLGGAGGFHVGIKSAYERGADWVWIMDDDAVPNVDALERLVDSRVFSHLQSVEVPKLGYLASRVDWTDGTICNMNVPNVVRNWHDLHHLDPTCVRISTASFVSILISRHAIRSVGLPVKEFFIWFDDVEYTRRITEMEDMVAYYIPTSVVVHHTPINLFPMDMSQLNNASLWKYEYGMRNEMASTIRSRLGLIRAIKFFGSTCFRLGSNRKLKYFFALAASAIGGIFFNYKKLIVYPER